MKLPSVLISLSLVSSLFAERKPAPIPGSIPHELIGKPAEEEDIFAVASKQGSRVLISRDDGRTWKQSLLATPHQEDGGWHGNFAVYGLATTKGVLAVFSGWGTPGIALATTDGSNWAHLNPKGSELASVWDATAGAGVFLTSADMWRGVSTLEGPFQSWKKHRLSPLLDGGKTHHLICGYGEDKGGRFVVVGDNRHVFFSSDLGKTWKHSRIPEAAPDKQQGAVVFGNGIFLCSYPGHVARSADGGKTWTLHLHGLAGKRLSWRGLSFVKEEFWLTTRGGKGSRKSKDGITWTDLPDSTPGGRFVEGPGGTLINVERHSKTPGIRRSTDGQTWIQVFTPPEDDVTWDFSFLVSGKLRRQR